MHSLFSICLLIAPALIAMLIFIWIRQQHWLVKFCSMLLVCLIGFKSFYYYFPEQSLRERYAEKILHM